MSTYFCSDLHGEYDLFCRLLEKVRFSGGDRLYVFGDCIDKGKESLRLVRLLRELRAAVTVGNHEYDFLNRYAALAKESDGSDFDRVLERLQAFFPFDTLPLTWETVDFLDALPYYVEEETFIGVHAGVQTDEKGQILPMRAQSPRVMVFDRHFKEDRVVPKGKTVLFGHTPCSYDNGDGRFIKTGNERLRAGETLNEYAKIRLDTGVAFTGRLGLLRKEDMAEIYICRG